MTPTVVRIDRDGVAELALSRPESRNALTTAMLGELCDRLEEISADPGVRAVVLTGSGPVFCAGADLQELGPDALEEARRRRIDLVGEAMRRLLALDRPTIAGVAGAAVGAGFGLVLACDLCLASADARFSLPEVAKGFRLPEELVRRLAQVVGPMRAAEIAYAGAVHSADEGRAAGFVTRVLPHGDDPAEAARALAASLAARPPHSIATVALPLRELNRPEE